MKILRGKFGDMKQYRKLGGNSTFYFPKKRKQRKLRYVVENETIEDIEKKSHIWKMIFNFENIVWMPITMKDENFYLDISW